MEKIFEGAISCKALLEAGSRNCKKLYIDKKKNTKDTRYLAKIAKSRGCEVVFCSGSLTPLFTIDLKHSA